MKDTQEITQWLAKKLWILVLVVLLGMGLWIVILNNSNSNRALENKAHEQIIKTLEEKDKELEKENRLLTKDLTVIEKDYQELYENYKILLNDEGYTNKNPVSFILPNGEWSDIVRTIKPVANGKTELSTRFLDTDD